jgi:hypothetical protein
VGGRIVVAGIVLTLLLIRSEKQPESVMQRPNMVDPFSGLAPRP